MRTYNTVHYHSTHLNVHNCLCLCFIVCTYLQFFVDFFVIECVQELWSRKLANAPLEDELKIKLIYKWEPTIEYITYLYNYIYIIIMCVLYCIYLPVVFVGFFVIEFVQEL